MLVSIAILASVVVAVVIVSGVMVATGGVTAAFCGDTRRACLSTNDTRLGVSAFEPEEAAAQAVGVPAFLGI